MRLSAPSLPLALFALLLPAAVWAADVKIEGLYSLSTSDVMEQLGERLTYVKERPPTEARASDAAFLLENLLKKQGFQAPKVTWRTAGNTLTLVVEEGPRQYMGKVTFPDLEKEDSKRLASLFRLPSEERVFGPHQKAPFQESDVTEGLRLLTADYQSRGYWSAEVKEIRRDADPSGDISFVIGVTPGPRYRLRTAEFEGVPAELMAALKEKSDPLTGKPADTERLSRLRKDVESVIRSSGYQIEDFRLIQRLEGEGFVPHFTVKIGERQKLARVHVEIQQQAGRETRTNEERVLRRFSDLEGDWYDADAFDKRVRSLLATGAFSSVRTEKTTTDSGEVDTTLHIVESKARGTSFYLGAGSYEGYILGLKYHDRNLEGNLWNFSSGLELTQRGALGEVRISDPWVFQSDTYLGLRGFSITRQFPGYSKFETGLSAELARELVEHLRASLTTGQSYVDLTSDGIPGDQMGETIYTHQYLRGNLSYDRRDDPISPSSGYHLNGLAEIGNILGQSTSGYLRFETLGATYLPVSKQSQVNLSLRGGLLMPTSGNSDFPIDLRLFLGGPDSVRSFRYHEMGPEADNGSPLGGQSYWVGNAEYVHTLSGPLQGVTFLDAGSLSPRFETLGASETEIALGLGLRVNLPVGPIRLEYGHNMTRNPGEPRGAWSFSVGIAF
jgi:outer membrane protein insertion porin family